MIQVNIIDVLGPMPGDNTSFVIGKANERVFAIQCGYADADICHGLLRLTPAINPFDFLVETLEKVNITVLRGELDIVVPAMYGKLFLKAQTNLPLKIVTASPTAVVNSTLAAKAPLEIGEEQFARLNDTTFEYQQLKASFGELFPLPQITKTDLLRVLSEFVDKVQFRQSASV